MTLKRPSVMINDYCKIRDEATERKYQKHRKGHLSEHRARCIFDKIWVLVFTKADEAIFSKANVEHVDNKTVI